MELVVSVTFLCCGNVEIQVSLFLSRFRRVSWTEISRHVSVMFLSVDFRCCLFPLRFCKRISNLFAITKTTFTAFTRNGGRRSVVALTSAEQMQFFRDNEPFLDKTYLQIKFNFSPFYFVSEVGALILVRIMNKERF